MMEMGVGAPASAPLDLPSLLRSLLPKRSEEDKVAEVVRVSFGRADERREFEIPVLATRPNRGWRKAFNDALADTFSNRDAGNADDGLSITALLMSLTDVQLTLLRAYDQQHVLPQDEWLEDNATDNQILTAFLGVTAAAFPFEVTLAEMVLANRQAWNALMAEFRARMSSSLRSTAGPRATSKPN
jgi:hypothetical protein